MNTVLEVKRCDMFHVENQHHGNDFAHGEKATSGLLTLTATLMPMAVAPRADVLVPVCRIPYDE